MVLKESENKSLKEQNGWKPSTISHQNQLLEVMHKYKTHKLQILQKSIRNKFLKEQRNN